MKEIKKHIDANEFMNFYLLYGEETYLKKQYRDKLRKSLVDSADDMNYGYFEGKKINANEVAELAETMPFFAEKRLIVVENSGWFKKAPDDIDKKMEAFPDSTIIIFVEDEVDKRNRLFKWISKNGYASEMKTPSGSDLEKWIMKACKNEEKLIEKSTIHYLVNNVGSDMLMLQNELDKLFSYTVGREAITMDDVHEVCISQAVDKLYQMVDAISDKNQKKALLLYHDLLVLREPPMRILFNLTNHYRAMMKLRALSNKKIDTDELTRLCDIPKFSVGKDKAYASKYSYEELKDMVEECQMTDQKIKTGRIQDVVGIELLIVQFSS